MIQVWCYNKERFFTESIFIEKVDKNMTEIPITTGFYKAKFNGKEWTEGATEEEIKTWQEVNKPIIKKPTETELLQKQLLETQALVAELRYKSILKENGGM